MENKTRLKQCGPARVRRGLTMQDTGNADDAGFGERYERILHERGMTTRDVDHIMVSMFDEGLSPETQKNWMRRGTRGPRGLTLLRVARAIDVNPDYLYGLTDDPARSDDAAPAVGAPDATPRVDRRRRERRRRRGRAS